MNLRLKKQLTFIVEIDKLKLILRHTKLFDGSRRENDVEHSWHLAMMAILLAEHSNQPIDTTKVVKMVLIHDVVEIDAGDVFVYSKERQNAAEKESVAAERIFGMLPEDQRDELIGLWREFEERKTPEARFAAALDRIEPVMQNYMNRGLSWKENDVKAGQVMQVNSRIGEGSETLWETVRTMIEECIEKGWIDQ